MFKKSFLFLLLCSCTVLATAQVRQDVQAEDAALAKKLIKQYPTDDFAGVERTVNYTFDLVKSKSGYEVQVTETMEEQLMQIKDDPRMTFMNTIFYDSTSTIEKVVFMDKKGRKLSTLGFTGSSSYTDNGIFHSDAMLYKMGFPTDGQGCVTKYAYEKKYLDLRYFISHYFQDYYPIIKETVTFNIPSWLTIDLLLKNGDKIKKSTAAGKDGVQIVTYTASNLIANKNERNAPGPSYILPHVLFHVKSYKDKSGKQYTVFNSTDDLYKWYSSLVKQIGNNPDVIKPLVNSLIKDKKTDQEKIETLFYWVQDNVRYIAFENGIAGFRPDACQKVYKNKYGDCKGMANLLKEMLVIAGYDARLTWIGTDIIAYDYSVPSMAVDNHMICTLILNGKKYFLDPTETYISFGDVAHRIQGRQAMIEDGDKYILERLPEFGAERNKKSTVFKFTLKDNKLVGTGSESYDGEGKTAILSSYSMIEQTDKDDAIRKLLSRDDKNITVSDIKTTDFEDRSGTMKFDYNIAVDNMITDLDNEKYVAIDFDQEFRGLTFDSTRTKDFKYSYKYLNTKKIELTVPAGYKVTHLPENIKSETENFSFSLNFKQEGNKIIYTKSIEIGNAYIPKSDFDKWNDTVKKLKAAYGDQIVLKKS